MCRLSVLRLERGCNQTDNLENFLVENFCDPTTIIPLSYSTISFKSSSLNRVALIRVRGKSSLYETCFYFENDSQTDHWLLQHSDASICLFSPHFRVEKESLEATVFESQQAAATLEDRCARVEEERRGLALANKALTCE